MAVPRRTGRRSYPGTSRDIFSGCSVGRHLLMLQPGKKSPLASCRHEIWVPTSWISRDFVIHDASAWVSTSKRRRWRRRCCHSDRKTGPGLFWEWRADFRDCPGFSGTNGSPIHCIVGTRLLRTPALMALLVFSILAIQIFQDVSYNDSLAKVWSLTPPQIALQPEGTVVKSSVAVEFNVSSHGGEPFMALYFEKDITVTIQASYGQKNLALHLTNALIEPKMFKCSSDITVSDDVLNHMLEKIILVAGIPKVISKIAASLTALMDRNGLGLFDIKDPEIITREGSFIVQLDFGFSDQLLIDFLKRSL